MYSFCSLSPGDRGGITARKREAGYTKGKLVGSSKEYHLMKAVGGKITLGRYSGRVITSTKYNLKYVTDEMENDGSVPTLAHQISLKTAKIAYHRVIKKKVRHFKTDKRETTVFHLIIYKIR